MKLLSDSNINVLSEEELKEKFPDFFTTQIDFSDLSKEAIADEFTNVFQKGMHHSIIT